MSGFTPYDGADVPRFDERPRRSHTARRATIVALAAVLTVVGLGVVFGRPFEKSSKALSIADVSTTAENEAVQWATARIGSSDWNDLCLEFAFDAYTEGANMHLESDVRNVAWNDNTDPEDVWGNGGSNFLTGTWEATSNHGSIPYGALVFFNALPGYSPEWYSHVTIMGADGVMISTPDVAGSVVHTETFAQAAKAWNSMVGWWLPDGSSSTNPQPPSSPTPPVPVPPSTTHTETVGGTTHTWSDYKTAGGAQGATIPDGLSLQVSCKVEGFRVADGDTWWYMVATAPWHDGYYASADAFYNDGATSGSLQGTPFVDEAVPTCTSAPITTTPPSPIPPPPVSNPGPPPTVAPPTRTTIKSPPKPHPGRPTPPKTPTPPAPVTPPAPPVTTPKAPTPAPVTYAETVGGVSNTWTDYQNAGGYEGPQIPAYQTIQITCRTQGFAVADGNTWWYEIAQTPWNNVYWVSADAFYNNGETSGSLLGTPFYDPNVPVC